MGNKERTTNAAALAHRNTNSKCPSYNDNEKL